jgi:hypothetical protein
MKTCKLLFLSLFIFSQSFGQNNTESEAEIKLVIDKFYTSLNDYFNGESNKNDAINYYLSNDFVLTRYTENLKGEVITLVHHKESYLNELYRQKSEIGLKFEHTKIQIQYSFVEGNMGTLAGTFHTKVTNKAGDTVALYTANIYAILEKIENKWSIHAMVATRTVELQKMGICPCKVVQMPPNDNTVFKVYLSIPSGTVIQEDIIDVKFIPSGTGFGFFINDKAFVLDNQKLMTGVDANGKQELLGRPTSRIEAVRLALTKSVYKNRCVEIKTQ